MGKTERTIFCLAGTPGTGKSTIRQRLLEGFPDQVVFLSRFTTRDIRPGEEGETVHLARSEFIEKSRAGHLTARYCSNGAMYALSVQELERHMRGSYAFIGCISASAGLALQERGYPCRILYLTALKRDTLVTRLRNRGETYVAIQTRMHEFDDADREWLDLTADRVLLTDIQPIEDTVQTVAAFIGLSTCSPSPQDHGHPTRARQ